MAPPSNNGPGITWTNIIGTLALLLTAGLAGWTIFQTQFAGLKDSIAMLSKVSEQADREIRGSMIRHEAEIRGDLKDIRDELRERRKEFPTQIEYKEYVRMTDERLSIIQKQLERLEQTRPTTGELDERVRSLEDYIRGARRDVLPVPSQNQR